MKTVLMLIALLVPSLAYAEYIDLSKGEGESGESGGMITNQQPCEEDGVVYFCFVVQHKGKEYVVLHDAKGEKLIYLIKEGKLVLLWRRDAI